MTLSPTTELAPASPWDNVTACASAAEGFQNQVVVDAQDPWNGVVGTAPNAEGFQNEMSVSGGEEGIVLVPCPNNSPEQAPAGPGSVGSLMMEQTVPAIEA